MKKLLFIPVTAVALVLSVSACGDSEDDAGSAAPPSASAPAAQQPSGGATTGQTPAPAKTSNGGGKLTPAQRELQTKIRDCMVKKGYGMPEVDGNNPVLVPTDKNGKSDEQVNKDAGECLAATRPSFPAGG
ncbi:hypothetical protein HUT06_05875 [Actinomadura sp. NAK00032]|uniref:hypothetical protein n=1 Tax=Actinomadura sp. NAK00032 TaxID=2742128 RepID=UPI0015924971|nr:hypothetical protein [Actinomadura sp. NAK00032]QKW33617.1 hypothetical protein HUT06_05875 [Actinomadura sp. NAK00032]